MLRELHVKDFALIDKLDLEWDQGFTVLTGETGAGKSILLGAVGLALGDRASLEDIRTGCEAAVVTALFDIREQEWLKDKLRAMDLDPASGELLLKREIQRNGRSRCWINGETVTQNMLQAVGEHLVDMHGQHEHQSLLDLATQRTLLDQFAKAGDRAAKVAKAYGEYLDIQRTRQALVGDPSLRAQKIDLLQFQVQELTEARLKPKEDETLHNEYTLLSQADKLFSASQNAYQKIEEGPAGSAVAAELLGEAIASLDEAAKLDVALLPYLKDAKSLQEQTQELGLKLRQYAENIEFNPEKLAEISSRLDLINRLKKKYGPSLEQAMEFKERASKELDMLSGSEEKLKELAEQEKKVLKVLGQEAQALSQARKKGGQELRTRIQKELAELAMPGVRFEVKCEWQEDPNGILEIQGNKYVCDANGLDQVEFLIAPNAGEELKPLIKIASGGEISRVMLAMKAILAPLDQVATMIFDEVDTGIGGRVAEVVGKKIAEVARSRQVICITHLPQIASLGQTHFFVSKETVAGRTATRVELLSEPERVKEIARMLGGEKITDTALQHAKEMMGKSTTSKGIA